MRERRRSINPHECDRADIWLGRVCLFMSGAVFILALDLVWSAAK